MTAVLKQAAELREELFFHRDLCRDILKRSNNHSLYAWDKGRSRYYTEYHDGGPDYIGRKDDRVEALQESICAKEVLEVLNRDIALLDKLLDEWEPYDLSTIKEELPLACQDLSAHIFDALGFIEPQIWDRAHYQKNNKYPENLIHETRSGLMVRSRGEVFIADTYNEMGIPFHYEEIMELPNGAKWFSDFTILPYMHLKWHEHFGNLKDPDNLKRFLWKEQQCIMCGIRPYKDILFTFDGPDGEFNARYLRQSIEDFVAICD